MEILVSMKGKYNWIPEGWAMEIRVGWEGNKIFKVRKLKCPLNI
jgi:hypothetical protein